MTRQLVSQRICINASSVKYTDCGYTFDKSMDLFGYTSDRAMVMYDVLSFVEHLKYYVVMLAVIPDTFRH